jgi:hypothetical protein
VTGGAPAACRLVVVADDLGYDPGIDEGLLEAHARGIVTAASAMVDGDRAAAAIRGAPATLALGLHLVLRPGASPSEARAEVERQLRKFEELRGAPPAHLDGHRHVHAEPDVLAAVAAAAAPRALRVRALDPAMRDRLRAAGVPAADRLLGDAARRPCWTAGRLIETLEALEPGTSELMCHPGRAPREVRTSFGIEREEELAALCDPRAREAIARRGAVLAGRL